MYTVRLESGVERPAGQGSPYRCHTLSVAVVLDAVTGTYPADPRSSPGVDLDVFKAKDMAVDAKIGLFVFADLVEDIKVAGVLAELIAASVPHLTADRQLAVYQFISEAVGRIRAMTEPFRIVMDIELPELAPAEFRARPRPTFIDAALIYFLPVAFIIRYASATFHDCPYLTLLGGSYAGSGYFTVFSLKAVSTVARAACMA